MFQNLNIKFAWVVNSEDGLDEISPFAKTNVVEVKNNLINENRSNSSFDDCKVNFAKENLSNITIKSEFKNIKDLVEAVLNDEFTFKGIW